MEMSQTDFTVIFAVVNGARKKKPIIPWLEDRFGTNSSPEQPNASWCCFKGQTPALEKAQLITTRTSLDRLTHEEMYYTLTFLDSFQIEESRNKLHVEAPAGDSLDFCQNRSKNHVKTVNRSTLNA